jgi:hypothetical protein
MLAAVRNRVAVFYAIFYWIGVVLTIGCFALILAGNTELFYQFEHSRLPLSWMVAGGAIFGFLAAEFCHPAKTVMAESVDETAEIELAWEGVEA